MQKAKIAYYVSIFALTKLTGSVGLTATKLFRSYVELFHLDLRINECQSLNTERNTQVARMVYRNIVNGLVLK